MDIILQSEKNLVWKNCHSLIYAKLYLTFKTEYNHTYPITPWALLVGHSNILAEFCLKIHVHQWCTTAHHKRVMGVYVVKSCSCGCLNQHRTAATLQHCRKNRRIPCLLEVHLLSHKEIWCLANWKFLYFK